MSELIININTSGVKTAEREVIKSFKSIVDAAKKVDSGISNSEKELKILGVATTKLKEGISQLNKGLITAEQFQLRYSKAISLAKNSISSTFGEQKKYENLLLSSSSALKALQKQQQQAVKDTKAAKEAQERYNRSVTSNTFKRGAAALREIRKEVKAAEAAQKRYNRSITSNELKRGATALRTIRKEQEKLRKEQEKNKKSILGFNSSLFATFTAANLASKAITAVVIALSEAPRLLKEYSDEWIKVNNIIRLGVNSQEELVAARQKVIDIAQETRTPLESQVTLFNRLTLSQKELGASSDEILSVIRGVGQALGVTATSTLEARGSLIQLAQAFGQPIVRAEELNSILEGTPRIAKALADGFGLTRAQLRKLVLDGKVTNKEFFEAFKSQLPLLEREFSNVLPTIDQGLVVLRNGLVTITGQFNELTGAAPAVAGALVKIGNALKGVGDVIGKIAEATAEKSLKERLDIINTRIKNIEDEERGSTQRRLRREKAYADSSYGIYESNLRKREEAAKKAAQNEADFKALLAKREKERQDKLKAVTTRPSEKRGLLLKELESTKAVIQASLDFFGFEEAAEAAEKRLQDEIRGRKQAEIDKIDAIKQTYRETGKLSEEGKRILIKEIEELRDKRIKAGNDRVTEEQAAAIKIKQINDKLNKDSLKILEKRISIGIQAQKALNKVENDGNSLTKEKQELINKLNNLIFAGAESEKERSKIIIESGNKIKKNITQLILDYEKFNKEQKRAILINKLFEPIKPPGEDFEKEVKEFENAVKSLTELNVESALDDFFKDIEEIGKKGPFDEYLKGLNESVKATNILQEATVSAFKTMEDALTDFILTGKLEWKDYARVAIAEITRIFVRSQIIAPLANMFSGANILGSIGSIFSAHGNTFDRNGVTPFAHGGAFTNSIVQQPTMFAHGGGIGVMGEKGDEVIAPLFRGSSGDIGVKSTPPVVNIEIVNNKANDTQVNTNSFVDDQGRLTLGIVVDALQRNVGGFKDQIKRAANER